MCAKEGQWLHSFSYSTLITLTCQVPLCSKRHLSMTPCVMASSDAYGRLLSVDTDVRQLSKSWPTNNAQSEYNQQQLALPIADYWVAPGSTSVATVKWLYKSSNQINCSDSSVYRVQLTFNCWPRAARQPGNQWGSCMTSNRVNAAVKPCNRVKPACYWFTSGSS